METASFFHVFVTGQIESARFPLGPDCSQIFCRYEVFAGPDWELISGTKNGISQSAVVTDEGNFNGDIVFNFPIEVTLKSTIPFGWPQIVISIYGKNRWALEKALGYCRLHIPIGGNKSGSRISVPVLIPKCTTFLAEISSWLSGKKPELKNRQILIEGTKHKGLVTESYGEMIIYLQTISRGINRMGYDWGHESSS